MVLLQGRQWEESGEYQRAVECYLKIDALATRCDNSHCDAVDNKMFGVLFVSERVLKCYLKICPTGSGKGCPTP